MSDYKAAAPSKQQLKEARELWNFFIVAGKYSAITAVGLVCLGLIVTYFMVS